MTPLLPPTINRIAIIGAGPAGVAAAKYLLSETTFTTLDLFEQQSTFGGVWNYYPTDAPHQPAETPQTSHLPFPTPMYENLESNLPHTLMQHSDAPLPATTQLFPPRSAIQHYLINYAAPVTPYVRFETQATSIRRDGSGSGAGWNVATRNVRTGEQSAALYDAIVVANGHYTVPCVPRIRGLEAWSARYPGCVRHSREFRGAEGFRGRKVLVVGNAASGTDVAGRIAGVCRGPVLLAGRSEAGSYPVVGEGVETVGEVVEFLPAAASCSPAKTRPEQRCGERAVRFADGRVEEGVEAVVFATGYYYSFPFLESLDPPLVTTGERVEGLFQHLFWIEDPTLVFIGLPARIVPFRTFEAQASVMARVWSRRLELPPRGEMRAWEEGVVKERGAGKAFHVLPFPSDFEYLNEMVRWAEEAKDAHGGCGGKGKVPPKWNAKETWTRERIPAIKRAFTARGEERHAVRTLEDLGFDYEGWVREREKGKVKERSYM